MSQEEPRTRKVARSKKTGRFVKRDAPKHRPDIAREEDVPLSLSDEPAEMFRSLKTGRFVRASTAKRYKDKTRKEYRGRRPVDPDTGLLKVDMDDLDKVPR